MKVTFYSNYLNHHQIPFSNEMYKLLGDNYTFVATEPMEQERTAMGWGVEKTYPYELRSYQDSQSNLKALRLGAESDLVITGSAPEHFIGERLKCNKLTFRYSERIYKQGLWRAVSPRGIAAVLCHHTRYFNKKVYMLCASGYTAYDFSLLGAYKGKTYKWGYFPELREYSLADLLKRKDNKVLKLLWAGRFLDWKHTEDAIRVAQRLQTDGIQFTLDIIGTGEREAYLRDMVVQTKLSNTVTFLGAMSPEKVRVNMENANIFLFTSDYQEGWGAVLNEAMNSGCAVVASHAIGAVPFLMQHGQNGLVYQYGDHHGLYDGVKALMLDRTLREKLGTNGYLTIANTWNAKAAARRLLDLAGGLMAKPDFDRYSEGPCSKANVVSQGNMYQHLINLSKLG